MIFSFRYAALLLITSIPVLAGWQISNVAGTGQAGWSGDGSAATTAQINDPYGIVRGPDGAFWFCEHAGHRIRRIAADGKISTIAGTGEAGYSGDGGSPHEAKFNLPHELRFGPDGKLYVADTGNNVVRCIDLEKNIITTYAGSPARGYTGDEGSAREARFNGPHSIQFGPDRNLYICDVGNHVIRVVDSKTGIIRTIAGTGKAGPTPDGAKIEGTPLNSPRSLDFDFAGNLWIVTREGNQVFKIDFSTATIHLIAGTGKAGCTGNGGPARQAQLSGPKGISIDAEGNVWLADTESQSIRRIDARTGVIDVIAGTTTKGDGPVGAALACALNRPHGVFADRDGTLYIGDSEAHRVRRLKWQ